MVNAALPETWRPDGSGRISARLAGTLSKPVVDVTLGAEHVQIANQTIDAVRSTLQVAGNTVTVSAFEATQQAGRLTATGQYSFDSRQYAFEATGTNIAIDESSVRARGDLSN